MSFRYIKFVISNIFKKKSVIIFTVLYIFCLLSFLILVPILTSMDVLNLWSNTTFAIAQTYLIFICAIFCGTVAAYIFRESAEDGTELIIMSKPISRFKIIISKFVAFLIISLIIALICEVVVLMCLFVPQMQKQYMLDLALSVFIGNIIVFMVFGSIAILLAICFNKVIVILINTGIVLAMFIFQILALIVIDSPLSISLKNGINPTSITTMKEDENGNYIEKQYVQFKIISEKITPEIMNYFNTQEGTKEYWTHYVGSKDKSNIAEAFNFASQLGKTFNSVGLNDYSKLQATRLFAFSNAFVYALKDPLIKTANTDEGIGTIFSGDKTNGYPKNITTFGLAQTNSTVFLGEMQKNAVPIGNVYESTSHKKTNIYYDKDIAAKYENGFEAIYKYIFNPYYYLSAINVPDYDLWKATNLNQSIFYDLLAMSMVNPESIVEIVNKPNYFPLPSFANNKKTIKSWFDGYVSNITDSYFDINSVFDLNVRIIQFKYWSFNQLIKDEQIIFNMFKEQNPDVDFNPTLESAWTDFFNFNTHISSSWIGYDKITWFNKLEEAIEPTNLIDLYFKISSIESGFNAYNPENGYYEINYDVTNPNIPVSFTRNELIKYKFNFYNSQFKASAETPLFTNVTFWYDVNNKTLPWVYVLIWLTISIAVFSIGVIIYSKHDIK